MALGETLPTTQARTRHNTLGSLRHTQLHLRKYLYFLPTTFTCRLALPSTVRMKIRCSLCACSLDSSRRQLRLPRFRTRLQTDRPVCAWSASLEVTIGRLGQAHDLLADDTRYNHRNSHRSRRNHSCQSSNHQGLRSSHLQR